MLISEAFAQAADSGQASAGWANMILLIGIFVIFWLLLIRPQAKRAKEHKLMVENLKRGDEVIAGGGIIGSILNVSESYVVIEIAPGVEVISLRTSVQTLLPKGTLKSIEPNKGGRQQQQKKGVKAAAAQEDATSADDSNVETDSNTKEDTNKSDNKN